MTLPLTAILAIIASAFILGAACLGAFLSIRHELGRKPTNVRRSAEIIPLHSTANRPVREHNHA